MSQDLYQFPRLFLLDELLTEEHKLIRDFVGRVKEKPSNN